MNPIPVESAEDRFACVEKELHDLAQPLSSLQCRLEIGLLSAVDAATRETLQESMAEVKRVIAAFSRVREVAASTSQSRAA